MTNKKDILEKIRRNINTHSESYDMPQFDAHKYTHYIDPLGQFVSMTETVGGKVIMAENDDINDIVRKAYPYAKVIASNVMGINIATLNPDTVKSAQELNGTDVGIVKGDFGVAENGCIWIPQTMKERAVCFISDYLVILLKRCDIVNNMHEAYACIQMTDYGYGTFISGPSKTADIAQALVMGAQAARGVTVVLM